jgi:hypothetical protein
VPQSVIESPPEGVALGRTIDADPVAHAIR